MFSVHYSLIISISRMLKLDDLRLTHASTYNVPFQLIRNSHYKFLQYPSNRTTNEGALSCTCTIIWITYIAWNDSKCGRLKLVHINAESHCKCRTNFFSIHSKRNQNFLMFCPWIVGLFREDIKEKQSSTNFTYSVRHILRHIY